MTQANSGQAALIQASDQFWKAIRGGQAALPEDFVAESFRASGHPLSEGDDFEESNSGFEALRDYFREGGGLTNLVTQHVGVQVIDDVGLIHDWWVAELGLGEAGSPRYISGRATVTFRSPKQDDWRLAGWLGTPGPHEAVAGETRADDVQAIREQILRVFEAYRQKDLSMLRRTHTSDWRGFTLRSGSVGKGIDAYMRGAQGAISSMQFQEYEILELDAIFYGDLAVVPYVARIAGKNRLGRDEGYRLRVMDVYLREPTGWNQVATNVCLHPEERLGS